MLCVHNTDHTDDFEKAILKAHELDEIAGALESYQPLAVGKTLQGTVFVNNEVRS